MTEDSVDIYVKRKTIKTQHPNPRLSGPDERGRTESKASFSRPPAARLYFQLIRNTRILCLTGSTGTGQIESMWSRKDFGCVTRRHRTKLLGQAGRGGWPGAPPQLRPRGTSLQPQWVSVSPPVPEGGSERQPGNLTKELTMAGPHAGATKSALEGQGPAADPERSSRQLALMSSSGANTGLDHLTLAPLPGSCWPHRDGGPQIIWVSCGTLGTTPGPPGQQSWTLKQHGGQKRQPTPNESKTCI